MTPGGSTEIISHFIGYLELIDDIARVRIDYQEGALKFAQEDYRVPLGETPYQADLEEFLTARMRNPFSAAPESSEPTYPHFYHAHLKSLPGPHADHANSGILSRLPGPSGGGGGGGEVMGREIEVHYRSGGDQLLADLKQFNLLNDNDLLLVGNGTAVTALHDINVGEVVRDLVDESRDMVPEDLRVTQASTSALIDLVASRDADTAARGSGEESEHSVVPARYVNGELQPVDGDDASAAAESEPTPSSAEGVVPGQWAELGGNEGLNAGLIVDLTESCQTMIVLGDYFKTDAIVQTNAYIDNDQVETAAGQLIDVIAGNDKADNIANFGHEPAVYFDTTGTFAGYNWNVSVVDGNFYDVRFLSQENYLCDNDVIVQDSSLSHYSVVAGANVQYNVSNLFAGDFKYDVIIIGGAFHGLNFIVQNNVLLDNDIVKLAATDDADPDQSVDTGDNALLNDASIITYGDQVLLPLGDGMDDLAAALMRGDVTLDPATFGDIIPGNGSGTLNVLYVTGDYYDVNMIWQVNVFADVDTAIQFLHGADGGDGAANGATTTQSVTTGSNTLTNDAAIIDVGATSTFVDGEVYGDTILVQADLVTDDEDDVVHADPDALVSELIAFTSTDHEEDQETPPASPVGHDDSFAHMLT
jgi:hypothetical protein